MQLAAEGINVAGCVEHEKNEDTDREQHEYADTQLAERYFFL
jgi:hypothetical protein